MTNNFDNQINHFAFWSAIVVLVTAVISFLLPLDAPGGYTVMHENRIIWLNDNRELFIIGWINQMVCMLSLTGVLLGIAWHVSSENQLRALIAAMIVFASAIAFVIPKFIAIWTIPQLAHVVSTGGIGTELADSLLRLLNVSIPFSLYTSFDYLGFWLYALFGLIVAGPLSRQSLISKVTAASLGLFGVLFHCLLGALLAGQLASSDIETPFLIVFALLLVPVTLMMIAFKQRM
ncbi:MAG: hypothetical protein OSA77_12705 [Halioglobus sp.]|nr:hypothetical protein [Halioglobus sp.]